MIFFTVISPQGYTQNLAFGSQTMEDCIKALTIVVREGFQLTQIELVEGAHSMVLPVEAFDGTCLLAPLQQLQQEWEQLLYAH